jgi:hypothetical protein
VFENTANTETYGKLWDSLSYGIVIEIPAAKSGGRLEACVPNNSVGVPIAVEENE